MSDVKPVALDVARVHELISGYKEADKPASKQRARREIVAYFIAHDAALQAEIEVMRQKAGTGRAIIIDLLDQIESLQSYELTRDLEGYKAQAIWDSAIENAKRYAAIAKEKQP